MNILGIETSTFSGSVSISRDETVLCEYVFNTGPRHNEVLVPTLCRIISECGLKKDDLDAVCVSIGPGSFTSLRIGVSTAKTLCYSLGTDLAGVCSLEVLASLAMWSGDDVCVMIDAGREDVYLSFYDSTVREMSRAEITSVRSACAKSKAQTVFIGSGAVVHKEIIRQEVGSNAVFLPTNLNIPRASSCATLGRKKILQGKKDDPLRLTPFYLRRSGAERNAKSKP